MNHSLIFDFTVLAIVFVLAINGIWRGLVREGFGLAGIVFGVYLSTKNASTAGQLIKEHIYKSDNEVLLTLFGFVIILLCIWCLFIIAGIFISKLVKLSGLGMIDKICGYLFGVAKIFIIISIIITTISNIPVLNKKVAETLKDSFMYPTLLAVGSSLAKVSSVNEILEKNELKLDKDKLQQISFKE